MNTIVFVLVVTVSHGFKVPTIEFSTMAKCEAAIVQIVQMEKEFPHGFGVPNFRGRCVKIEK